MDIRVQYRLHIQLMALERQMGTTYIKALVIKGPIREIHISTPY